MADTIAPPEGFQLDAPPPPPGFQLDSSPSKGTAMPGQLGALAGKAEQTARSALAQKDRGIDYSGVNEPNAQAAYSLISKPEDRTKYLQMRYGSENVSQDSFGRDVVNVNGKKVAFKSREDNAPFLQGAAAHAGDVLPVGGMIAGAVAGSPLGAAGSIGLAGLGGGAGVAANSLIANAAGLPSSQSPAEVAGDIRTGTLEGMAAEGLGQVGMFVGRSLLGPYRAAEGDIGRSVFGPMTERSRANYLEQMKEVEAARALGLRPRVGTFAPNAPLVQRMQQAGMRVFGDELPSINRPILEGKVNELTAQAGQGSGVPANDLNAALSRRADTSITRAQFAADTAIKDAGAELRNAQSLIEARVGTPTGKLAGNANEDILASRQRFGEKASMLYAPIDAMAGRPVVPTQPIKDMLDQIVNTMPKTKAGELSVLTPDKLQKFKSGIDQLPDYVSFQQMQAIRAKFRSASDVSSLEAGLSERQAGQLSSAADSAFDAASKSPFAGAPEAEKALRRADYFYRAGMKRFDDLSVQALVKDASETGFIQPEKVATYIANPGQVDKLQRIKKVVSNDTFQQVGAERWKQMVNDSEDILTGQIDGKKLAKRLSDMGKSLDVLYGPAQAQEMRGLAEKWAMLGGKADTLSGPQFLKDAVQAQEKSSALASADWSKNIRTDGPQSLRAADYLTQPENRLQFRQAASTFGPQSPEIAATKEYLARKIFSVMEQPAIKGAEKYGKTELMGQPLLSELNRYGRPYLEEVFGKQWTDGAFGFARAAEVATRKNPSDAAAIVVAAYALKPFSHIGGLVKMFGAQEILSSPSVITYMTRGIEGGGVNFMRAMGTIATRSGLAYQAVNAPRNAADYASGVANKLQSPPQPPQEAQPAMQGVRG